MITGDSRSSHDPVAAFYDSLSADYDVMTGFEKRFDREESTFRELVTEFKISSAVDAGCGTGFHSCVLARLGVDVTGVDVSGEMIARASARARAMNLKVKLMESSFENIGADRESSVDAVFCMGNSLAHLLSRRDIQRSLRSFHGLLKVQGVLFVQVLNYDRIMFQKRRVQSVREEGDVVFVRFYDFEGRRIRFNVLTLRRTSDGFQHHLESVGLRPIGSAELRESLASAGFRDITMFGNANLERFDPAASVDLFVIARKHLSRQPVSPLQPS